MADVYTVTFIIIGIFLSVPALLVALNLLLPRTTMTAYLRLKKTPGRSFALGLPLTILFVGWTIVTVQASFGLLRFTAFLSACLFMSIGSIGGAGMARLLGERLGHIGRSGSDLTHLIRGAVVYELAAFVPLVGWFLFTPLVGMTVVGAAVFGLLGWKPREPVGATVPPAVTPAPISINIAGNQ